MKGGIDEVHQGRKREKKMCRSDGWSKVEREMKRGRRKG